MDLLDDYDFPARTITETRLGFDNVLVLSLMRHDLEVGSQKKKKMDRENRFTGLPSF